MQANLERFESYSMCRCVFEKDTLRLFSFGPSSLTVVVAHPDERLTKTTPKKVLYVGVVRRTLNACFIRTNEPEKTSRFNLIFT